jgi:hypothetical protein
MPAPRKTLLVVTSLVALAGTLTFAASGQDTAKAPPVRPPSPPVKAPAAPAPPAKVDTKPAAPAQAGELPPGMSADDMAAYAAAAQTGPMHQHLAKSIGTWKGKVKHFMPGAPAPMESECVTVISGMMDGRFTRSETKGDMPGMGPFEGFGIYGFDNVSGKFQSTWADNFGTGMMTGTGELSPDGKTLNWSMTYNCPIKKCALTMREVERQISADAMTLEMFAPDPATGKEMKVMEIAYTRAPKATAAVETGR